MGNQTQKSANIKVVYLTLNGLEKLRTELTFLKNTRRIEIAQRLKDARELNSTEENAEYDAAITEQDMLENRINELERSLHNAQVIERSSLLGGVITLGSVVKIKMNQKIMEFTLVGKTEVNPLEKKISNESPVGQALLGAKKGEHVQVVTPTSSFEVKILEIR